MAGDHSPAYFMLTHAGKTNDVKSEISGRFLLVETFCLSSKNFIGPRSCNKLSLIRPMVCTVDFTIEIKGVSQKNNSCIKNALISEKTSAAGYTKNQTAATFSFIISNNELLQTTPSNTSEL